MIIWGTAVIDVFSNSVFNLVQYFDALLVGLIWTIGMVMMLNQKLTAEISEARDHFEDIFNTSPDALIINRLSDGVAIECNENYERLSGFSKDEIIGKSLDEIKIWVNQSERERIMRLIRDEGFCENEEARFRRKNGEIVTGWVSAKTIKFQGIPHVVSITRDISDRKKAEQEIRLKNEQLVKMNAEKDRFYSIIAHDLRSPFNSFLGLTSLLADELPSMPMEELQKVAASMKKSATSLFRLLENLLNWSRVAQGIMPYVPVNLNLKSLVAESSELVIEPARVKNITLRFDIPDDLEVFADPDMLQTILRNLLSNALKFTTTGGAVELSAQKLPGKRVGIKVTDNGVGMDQPVMDALFMINRPDPRKGTDGEPGTGLGLVLCHQFIEMHGGTIHVESELAKGSVFYIELPPEK